MSCIIEQPAADGDLLNYQTFDVGKKHHISHEILMPL